MDVYHVKKCDCCGRLYTRYETDMWNFDSNCNKLGKITNPILRFSDSETYDTPVCMELCKRCYSAVIETLQERWAYETGRGNNND